MLDKCPDPLVATLGSLQVLNDLCTPPAKSITDVLNLMSEGFCSQAKSHRLPGITDLVLSEPQLLFEKVNTVAQPTMCSLSSSRWAMSALASATDVLSCATVSSSATESGIMEHCLTSSFLLLLQCGRDRLGFD